MLDSNDLRSLLIYTVMLLAALRLIALIRLAFFGRLIFWLAAFVPGVICSVLLIIELVEAVKGEISGLSALGVGMLMITVFAIEAIAVAGSAVAAVIGLLSRRRQRLVVYKQSIVGGSTAPVGNTSEITGMV